MDHSNPSSSTILERTRKNSASIPVLASLGSVDGKGVGSIEEPEISSASDAARDMLSSSSLSSIALNETMSLASAEGRWSGRSKRTGDGESEARWVWGQENGRARGAESLSEKKAIRVRREVRLMCEHSISVRAASAWGLPRQETHSEWPSSACREVLHELQQRRGICNNTAALLEKFAILARWMAAGYELVSAPDAEGGSKSGRGTAGRRRRVSFCPQRGVSTVSGFKARRSAKRRSSSLKEN